MIDPNMPEGAMLPGEAPPVPGDDEIDGQLDAMGADRRREIATQATNGADPSTLPSDVQAALVEAAQKFAKATGTEHIAADLDGVVTLIASAHQFLLSQGRDDLAGIVDPALLSSAGQAMVLVQGLKDPEVIEAINADPGVTPPAEDAEPEAEPEAVSPEPAMMESP